MSLHAQLNVTPDGFCNHEAVIADDEFMRFATALIDQADRVLLGRKTFELFRAYWPEVARDDSAPDAERSLARAIDNTPRTVVSGSLKSPVWPLTEILQSLDNNSAHQLAESGNVLVLGSPSVIAQCLSWKVIDHLHLTVHPLLSGKGIHTPQEIATAELKCSETQNFASGAVDYRFHR